MNVLTDLISFYDSIHLEDMGRVKLLNRIDTKFLLSPDAIVSVLAEHIDDYCVVEINDQRLLTYNTTYYDSISFLRLNVKKSTERINSD